MRKIPINYRGSTVFALVDDEDYAKLLPYTWSIRNLGRHTDLLYVWSSKKGGLKPLAMHRFLTDAPKGMVVDHIDGNCLNNQKSNLRLCSQADNLRNAYPQAGCKSKFKGVGFQNGKWKGSIRVNRKRIHLGYFKKEVDAALAYNSAAVQYFGDFARLNVIHP